MGIEIVVIAVLAAMVAMLVWHKVRSFFVLVGVFSLVIGAVSALVAHRGSGWSGDPGQAMQAVGHLSGPIIAAGIGLLPLWLIWKAFTR